MDLLSSRYANSIFVQLTLLVALFCWTSAGGKCADSEVLVQKESPLPASNGCSKPASLQIVGEEDFTFCCDRHDACYSTCGVKKDFCEKDFLDCLKSLCSTTFKENKQCNAAAHTFVMGTNMFGGKGFVDLQNDYCKCLHSSKILDHYGKIYRGIYLKHSNKTHDEIESTIDNILNKAQQQQNTNVKQHPVNLNEQLLAKRLAGVLFRILKKYDTAIRHEDKRVGMNPPKPIHNDEL